ncbi:NfeD family protein [Fodinicurvata sediminis]|uniref:NfeD family protein n=1 Tax=Fodinicurvata sediminis TaxID=1121832 RepID=UPI0003B666FC|nr:nodulation protein NfeD [Fodinicurvata sediminis]
MSPARFLSRPFRVLFFTLLLAIGASLTWLAPTSPSGQEPEGYQPDVLVLNYQGPIGPASSEYLSQGLAKAREREAELIVLRLDTPGGLDDSMRQMIRDILASPVPVAVYVAPGGARAASAGTYILYAAHVAAMAPGTNLGAATPIRMGGLPLPFGGDSSEESSTQDADSEDTEENSSLEELDTSSTKTLEDAVAYIRALARLRDRNADWAERAVRQSASLSHSEALEEGVIDYEARTLENLLEQIDGMFVALPEDRRTRLSTSNATVDEINPDWRIELLAIITNPNLTLIFLMLGVYGLIFEFMNPGMFFPGIVGAICLLLGLYSVAVLPVNLTGFALLLLGLILMVGEAFAPSFGVLGIGGVAAFVLGGTLLFDSSMPGYEISPWTIGVMTLISVLLLIIVLRMAIRSHRRPIQAGAEEMIGQQAEVLKWSGGKGYIFVHGERWKAVCDEPLKKGQTVEILTLDGLTAQVRSIETDR